MLSTLASKSGRVLIAVLMGGCFLCPVPGKGFSAQDSIDSTQKIIIQSRIESEAKELEREGLYDEAIRKYQEVLNPSLINREAEKCTALAGIRDIHQLLGEFELAFQETQWFLKINPKKSEYLDKKEELEALTKARQSDSVLPIRQYIKSLKEKYQRLLPPKHCDSWASVRIIYAYDYIGDQEGGIQFANDALKYWAKIGPGNPYQPKNPYFQVKQAFEQDKQESFKGCLEAKPGEVCMGRATKAIIQSDYFPW